VRVGELDEAELLRRPQDQLLGQRDRCIIAIAGRREELEREVAVGDGVERVRGGLAKPSSAAVRCGRWGSRCRRARRRRAVSASRRASASRKRPSSRAEHLEVREQVVREAHRLRDLEVRVAGQDHVEVALGEVDEHAARSRSSAEDALVRARSARRKSVATWSLRSGRCGACRRPGRRLGEAPLEVHVDVLERDDQAISPPRRRAEVAQPLDERVRLPGVTMPCSPSMVAWAIEPSMSSSAMACVDVDGGVEGLHQASVASAKRPPHMP
jgi:hypothetical protein